MNEALNEALRDQSYVFTEARFTKRKTADASVRAVTCVSALDLEFNHKYYAFGHMCEVFIMLCSYQTDRSLKFVPCYRYIDDLIVFNNKKFLDYLKEIYPSQLTVEKASKSDHLADFLDLTFIIDSGGKLSTRLYDKRDEFGLHIVNFPFLSSNIPSGLFYGVYISRLIRYARCCSHYDDFRYRHKCLVDRLLSQGYTALRFEKSFKKFLWQISGSHSEIPEVSQRNGERFISTIIVI